MTPRDWHGDRRAVFDRDDRTCRRCGATGSEPAGTGTGTDADTGTDTDPGDDGHSDTAALRLYPVGDVPLEGTVHESSLVTVCESCFGSLRTAPTPTARPDDETLFALAREMTKRQGVTVSTVASFASLATSLPTDLEAAGDDADARADAEAEYLQTRREVLLAIDSVPSRLERLAGVERSQLAADVADPLGQIVDAGQRLQSELEEIVALCEVVAAGLDRCHGCLEPRDDEAAVCPTCSLEFRDVSQWRRVDGPDGEGDAVSFGHLFTAINDTLQDASDTTEELTDCAATLAGALRDEPSGAA